MKKFRLLVRRNDDGKIEVIKRSFRSIAAAMATKIKGARVIGAQEEPSQKRFKSQHKNEQYS